MKPKKALAQHFLIVPQIAERIASEVFIQYPGTKVLEIGPGKGILTDQLVNKGFDLILVEADEDMTEILLKKFPSLRSRLWIDDFLKFNLETFFTYPLLIVGNFPYNISSQIVMKMISNKDHIVGLVGMFQKEVARRITSPPGSKEYGRLSVMVQAHYHVKYLFSVPPGAFSPPPQVNSGVIRLTRKHEFKLPCDEKRFRMIVKCAFNQRRKMLKNSLKSLLGDILIKEDETIWKKRPEELAVEDFVTLTNKLS